MKKQSNSHSWTRGKLIGRGSFAHVSLAVANSDGHLFAVKSVDLDACLPGQLEALENEIRILRSFSGKSSPYVVGYLGDDVSHESPTTSYRNLHLEYLPGGTVADVKFSHRVADVDERILRWQVRCLVSALKFVHDNGIVHCDVKGKNVLVESDFGPVKLADFGSAMEAGKASMNDPIVPRGSPLWMAPEVIRREFQGQISDVWSLGCTVVEMVTGKPAWEDRGLESLQRIGYSNELPAFPTRLSELGLDFLEKCLRRDPTQRWSSDQLLKHPFVAAATPPNAGAEASPRCILDFDDADFGNYEETEASEVSWRDRIGKLAADGGPVWESDGWVVIRGREAGETSSDDSVWGSGRVDDEWQMCNFEEVGRVDMSSRKRHGTGMVELEVEKKRVEELKNLCNLVVFCNLRILRYFLLELFIIFYFPAFCSQISTSIYALENGPIKFFVGSFFEKKMKLKLKKKNYPAENPEKLREICGNSLG